MIGKAFWAWCSYSTRGQQWLFPWFFLHKLHNAVSVSWLYPQNDGIYTVTNQGATQGFHSSKHDETGTFSIWYLQQCNHALYGMWMFVHIISHFNWGLVHPIPPKSLVPAALETLGRLLDLMVNELPQAFILKKAIVSLGMKVTEERYLFFWEWQHREAFWPSDKRIQHSCNLKVFGIIWLESTSTNACRLLERARLAFANFRHGYMFFIAVSMGS